MATLIRNLLPAIVFALPLTAAPINAQEDSVDIGSYLCKDIMRMSEDERAVSLGVLHGYRLGKKGQTVLDAKELSTLSVEFIEYCLDHPQEKALATFEKLAK